MGITGLIPFLEKASSRIYLKDLRGSSVAVDTYCWLHKGVFACAEKLARGEETDIYLQYCLKYVNLLLSYDIKPILVFDGRHLPAKAITEKRRRDSRQHSKKLAVELLRLGKVEEARSHMRRSIDVTHNMALRLIRECRRRNVDCIVAPYEADAQLAWLNQSNLAEYVITEDSDLMLFGARNVIFKLDLIGSGLLIESEKLYSAMGCRKERYTFDKFRRMCILSGCDYLDSLPGIGLAKACKFICMTEEDDLNRALRKIPRYLNMRNLEVTDEYIENFHKAEATFRHMYVYNPLKKKMQRLRELSEYGTEEHYCSNAGILLEDEEQAFQLALGNLDPLSLKRVDFWDPKIGINSPQLNMENIPYCKDKSIWLANYEPHEKSDNKELKQKQKFCALPFKKIDLLNYVSNDFEAIEMSYTKDHEKPDARDVIEMYTNENLSNNPTSHMKGSGSYASTDSEYENSSPLSSQKTDQAKYNPFVKTNSKSNLATSCNISKRNDNDSLNIYDSQQHNCNKRAVQNLIFKNKQKQFILNEKQTRKNVKVKSRFFSQNVYQVMQIKAEKNKPKYLTNEIKGFSQQNQDRQLQLYNYDFQPSAEGQKPPAEGTEINGSTSMPTDLETFDASLTNCIFQILEISKNEQNKEILLSDEVDVPLQQKQDEPLLLPNNGILFSPKRQILEDNERFGDSAVLSNTESFNAYSTNDTCQELETSNSQQNKKSISISDEIEEMDIIPQQKRDQPLRLINHGILLSAERIKSLDSENSGNKMSFPNATNFNISNANSNCQEPGTSNSQQNKECIISDDESCLEPLRSPIKKILNLEKFTQRGRQLGLSKPKSVMKRKKEISNENQTRLSMFGFHKKPKLK